MTFGGGSCTKPTRSQDIASLKKITLPLIRKAYPKLIANNITSVQPMTGNFVAPVPAPREFVQAVRVWIMETFGILTPDTKRILTLSVPMFKHKLLINCMESHISIQSLKFYWEDPELFDQLEKAITLWLEGRGCDKLDCFLATFTALSRGIKPEPEPQPASLVYYLRYRYAKNPAKCGQKST